MAREFKLEGFDLVIEEDVLDHVVADALRRETGARGLASTLTRHLEDAAFGVFGVSEGAGTAVRVRIVDDDLAVDVG
jgi:ATP-dependent Clp protease ATP-binding subunit ClpX